MGKEIDINANKLRDPYKAPEHRKQEEKDVVVLLKEKLLKIVEKLGDKEVIGFSILAADKKGHELYGSYPDVVNAILMGIHTNMINREEISILTILAQEINERIEEKMKDGKEDEVES